MLIVQSSFTPHFSLCFYFSVSLSLFYSSLSSSVCTELSHCWLANTDPSIYKNPYVNVADDYFTRITQHILFFLNGWFMWWGISDRAAALLLGAAS